MPAEVATAVRNNGGGHWNHSFLWTVMGAPADSNGPGKELKAAIEDAFGRRAPFEGRGCGGRAWGRAASRRGWRARASRPVTKSE